MKQTQCKYVNKFLSWNTQWLQLRFIPKVTRVTEFSCLSFSLAFADKNRTVCVMDNIVTSAAQYRPSDQTHPPTSGDNVSYLFFVRSVHDGMLGFVCCFNLDIRFNLRRKKPKPYYFEQNITTNPTLKGWNKIKLRLWKLPMLEIYFLSV